MRKFGKDPIDRQPAGAEQTRADVRRCIQQIRALVVDYGNKLMAAETFDAGAVRSALDRRPGRPDGSPIGFSDS
ncbi:MAG TPA: hypothetical protein VJ859_09470 [Allosphingosinicella sp.]|nr:hypothetical protein [Allosphingosinicella sp.]